MGVGGLTLPSTPILSSLALDGKDGGSGKQGEHLGVDLHPAPSQSFLINSEIRMTTPRILLEWGENMPSSLSSVNDGFLSTPPPKEDA